MAAFNQSTLGAASPDGISEIDAIYLQQIASDIMLGDYSDLDGDGVPDAGYSDGFERGDLSNLDWDTSGDAGWSATSAKIHSENYALEAPLLVDDQSAALTLSVDVADTSLSFWYAVSSESGSDELEFYIDSVLIMSDSGVVNRTQFKAALTAGNHTLSWRYAKDGSNSSGEDKAWIDDIAIWVDNCGASLNSDQADSDDDGVGDVCDSGNDGLVSPVPVGPVLTVYEDAITDWTALSSRDLAASVAEIDDAGNNVIEFAFDSDPNTNAETFFFTEDTQDLSDWAGGTLEFYMFVVSQPTNPAVVPWIK